MSFISHCNFKELIYIIFVSGGSTSILLKELDHFSHCMTLPGLTFSNNNAIDLLIVRIPPVPGKLVLEPWVCFKHLLVSQALNRHLEVHHGQVIRYLIRSELDHDGGHVSGSLTAMVDQIHTCSRDLETLL